MKVQKREAFFYHKRAIMFIQQEDNLSFMTYISIWFHFEEDFFFWQIYLFNIDIKPTKPTQNSSLCVRQIYGFNQARGLLQSYCSTLKQNALQKSQKCNNGAYSGGVTVWRKLEETKHKRCLLSISRNIW